jgi:hypothetical protein
MDASDASSPASTAEPRDESRRRGSTVGGAVRSIATDPARCFLAIGTLIGVLLVFVAPPIVGIDEPAHFSRAYQVSTGRLIPQIPDGQTDGAGACLPEDRMTDLGRLIYEQYVRLSDGTIDPDADVSSDARAGCPPGERFFDFSAFGWYSFVSYVPQAVAIAVGRALGIGTTGLVILARLAGLAAYLAIVFVAIRRSPFARWGLCVVALLPVTLFQAATSRSPDTITIAVGMLVLGAALRAVKGGTSVAEGGSSLAERVALCALLGMLKPTYAVLSLCFLLPLWVRPRREQLRTLFAPIVAAFATSAIWQAFFGHYFICDTPLFLGWDPNTDDQISTILHSPATYLLNMTESFGLYGDQWLDETFTVASIYANWAWPAVALALVACILAAARRDQTERFELRWPQRALLVGIAFAGAVLVITGEHVYCAPVGLDVVYPPHGRHFLPVLPLLAVAFTPSRPPRGGTSRTDRVPSAALLLAVTVAFVVTAALEMR